MPKLALNPAYTYGEDIPITSDADFRHVLLVGDYFHAVGTPRCATMSGVIIKLNPKKVRFTTPYFQEILTLDVRYSDLWLTTVFVRRGTLVHELTKGEPL